MKIMCVLLLHTTSSSYFSHLDIPFRHRILRRLFSSALRWSRTGTASTNGTESPGHTQPRNATNSHIHNKTYWGDQTYRPLIGIDEEDLDDYLKLSPACLSDLIRWFCNDWKGNIETMSRTQRTDSGKKWCMKDFSHLLKDCRSFHVTWTEFSSRKQTYPKTFYF